MAKSIIGCQNVNDLLVNSTTHFWPFSNFGATATRANAQIEAKQAFIATNIRSYISANTAGSTSSIDLVQNSVGTTVRVEHGINATGWRTNTTDSVAINSGDLVNLGSQASGGGNRLYNAVLMEIASIADNAISYAGIHDSYIFSSSVTRYSPINGDIDNFYSTSEQTKILKTAYSVQNLYTYVSANTRTTDTTIYFRINSVDTALSVIYTTGQTGAKESLDIQLVVADDECSFKVVTSTGTGNITFQLIESELISENISNRYFEIGVSTAPDASISNTSIGILGSVLTDTTSANCEIDMPFDFIATNMVCIENSGGLTITLYVNGASSILAVVETGSDSDIVSVSTGDNLRFNSNGSGPFIKYSQISIQGYTVESGFKPQIIFINQG